MEVCQISNKCKKINNRKLFYSTRRSVHEKFKFDFREKEIEIVNQHLPNMLVLKIW